MCGQSWIIPRPEITSTEKLQRGKLSTQFPILAYSWKEHGSKEAEEVWRCVDTFLKYNLEEKNVGNVGLNVKVHWS